MFFAKTVITLALAVFASALYTPLLDIAERSAASEPWLSGTQYGDATYFEPGVGACGITNTASDYIVAVSTEIYDNYPGYSGGNPNDNPICRKPITVSYQGKSVTVTVTDRCVGCATTDVDLSPAAFEQLAPLSEGRISVSWHWD